MKRVAFASNSRIQESGSVAEKSASDDDASPDQLSNDSFAADDSRVVKDTKIINSSFKNTTNNNKNIIINATDTHSKYSAVDYPLKQIESLAIRKRSPSILKEHRRDATSDVFGKSSAGQPNLWTSSQATNNSPIFDNGEKKSTGSNVNDMSSTKKEIQCLRGNLKDQNLNLVSLLKPKISIQEADEVFDDEDERYDAKQLIKNYIIPNKKSQMAFQYKMFGMRPAEFEREYQFNKYGKLKKKSQISQPSNVADDKSQTPSDSERVQSNDGQQRAAQVSKTGFDQEGNTNKNSNKNRPQARGGSAARSGSLPQDEDQTCCTDILSVKKRQLFEYLEEQDENGRSSLFIISTSNWIFKSWQALTIVACLLSSYVYTNIAAFRMHKYEDEAVTQVYLAFEIFFFIDMIVQFFVERTPAGHTKPVRELEKLAVLYLKGDFIVDLIAILPLQIIEMNRNRHYLFLLVKCIRVRKCFRILQVRTIMQSIKKYYADRLTWLIETDEQRANSTSEDQTQIEKIMVYRYVIETLGLVILILNSSYFLGLFWYILCGTQEDLTTDDALEIDHALAQNQEYFQNYFELSELSPTEITVIATYFAFTSLSTVGFGDYHPRSDFERLCCSLILLFGVAIFSIIMGNFSQILVSFNSFNAGFDDGDNLTKFFGTIQKFNNMEAIDIALKERIEAFFEYKWEHDKNNAFQEKQDLDLFSQLPGDVQVEIYNKYLFERFLCSFAKVFTFPRLNCPHRYAFYTWTDQGYRAFMLQILQNLECRHEDRFVVLYNELDEMNEVLFFETGTFEIGYEINRFTRYILRFKNNRAKANVIGAYGATFNKRSLFKYRSITECRGYFIRKLNWQQVISDNQVISTQLCRQVSLDYEKNVLHKVMFEKNRDLKRWAQRADYDCVLAINNNKNDVRFNRDVPTSNSVGHVSADGLKSVHSMAPSISVDNFEASNNAQQNCQVAQSITSPTPSQSLGAFGRTGASVGKVSQVDEDAKGCSVDRNVHRCINMTRCTVDSYISRNVDQFEKTYEILKNVGALYTSYIQAQQENEELKEENAQLLQSQRASKRRNRSFHKSKPDLRQVNAAIAANISKNQITKKEIDQFGTIKANNEPRSENRFHGVKAGNRRGFTQSFFFSNETDAQEWSNAATLNPQEHGRSSIHRKGIQKVHLPSDPSSPASGAQLIKTKSCKMLRSANNISKKKEFPPNWRLASEVQDIDHFEEEKISAESDHNYDYGAPRGQDNKHSLSDLLVNSIEQNLPAAKCRKSSELKQATLRQIPRRPHFKQQQQEQRSRHEMIRTLRRQSSSQFIREHYYNDN